MGTASGTNPIIQTAWNNPNASILSNIQSIVANAINGGALPKDANGVYFVLTSAEDNLVKGASGQAVQIMNLWCGFPETAGLA